MNNWFTWNTNHHLHRPQVSSHSPKGEEALRPPRPILEAQAKLIGLVGTHAPDGNSARKARKNDTGESVFPETDRISLFFRFVYVPFVIHRDEYRLTRGSADQDLVLLCYV